MLPGSLDAPEQRGKDRRGNVRWVTPFERAKRYADNMTPRSAMPKWVITHPTQVSLDHIFQWVSSRTA